MHMQVLDWLRVVIDSHLPRLLMDKQPPAVMQGLQMALKRKVGMWISVDVCGYVSTMLRARSAATCVILLTFVALSSTGMAVCACVRACVNAIGHNTASFGDVQASASQPPDPH
jgi:hypothetical protein